MLEGAATWQWQRIVDKQPLIRAFEEERYGAMIEIINVHYVAPNRVTPCCGMIDAIEYVAKNKEEWQIMNDTSQ